MKFYIFSEGGYSVLKYFAYRDMDRKEYIPGTGAATIEECERLALSALWVPIFIKSVEVDLGTR